MIVLFLVLALVIAVCLLVVACIMLGMVLTKIDDVSQFIKLIKGKLENVNVDISLKEKKKKKEG